MINYKKIAFRDLATGCYNRNYYEYVVKKKWNEKEYDVYLFDLDNLKKTNDTLGHKAGNDLILEFSKSLSKIFSSKSVIIRYGGDEFIVILKCLYPTICLYNFIEDGVKKVTKIPFSYGLSVKNKGSTWDEVLNDADNKMYAMKRSKKNNE